MAETVLSPVNYAAWRSGYAPPTDHQLIDEIQFRGAHVKACDYGSTTGWWIVTKGDWPLDVLAETLRSIADMLDRGEARAALSQ